ncbi:MAG: BMP family protein [Megasphaera cerevisiae]|nr:BMP family protein [Megasphaera cerevisiae]
MSVKNAILCLFAAVCMPMAGYAATVETARSDMSVPAEIAVLLPGNAYDNGFMEAGYRGYQRIAQHITTNIQCVSDVSATSDAAVLTAELQKLAQQGPKLIIAHGGQMNEPVSIVSKEFSQIQFAVIQGNVKGLNVSSYTVDQEQSAFLAGALAGYMTKSGKVGHISGAWPKPGLQARAAFYDGLMYANPKAQFYSTFTGNLDDKAINGTAAKAQIQAGCDIIYTMLNGGRGGVTDVISQTKGSVKEIGNVMDWTTQSPVFIGSAVADSSEAVFSAARDYTSGVFTDGRIIEIGLENPAIVRLAVSKDVPAAVVEKMTALQKKVLSGEVTIHIVYTGQEFDPVHNIFVSQEVKNQKKK